MPFASFAVIWSLTDKIAYTAQPFTAGYLSDGIRNVIQGNINWGDVGYLIKAFFIVMLDPTEWGFLGWLILIGLVMLFTRRNKKPETIVVFTAGILLTLAAASIIYLRGYNPAGCDVSCMVNTAMERLILPGIALLWVGASEILLGLWQKK